MRQDDRSERGVVPPLEAIRDDANFAIVKFSYPQIPRKKVFLIVISSVAFRHAVGGAGVSREVGT